jgi:hypothetical protein
MQAKNRSLQILMAVLVVLIVIASIVVAKVPRQREVVYYNTAPDFDKDLMMLGVRMSKFGGMSIYMDSPSVILAKSEELQLTDDQQHKLQAIVEQAREKTVALLTEAQVAGISPIPSEPIVLEKMDKTISSCASGACDISHSPQELPDTHEHDGVHAHDHEHKH